MNLNGYAGITSAKKRSNSLRPGPWRIPSPIMREATTIPRATRASDGFDSVILALRKEETRTQVYDGCRTEFNLLDENCKRRSRFLTPAESGHKLPGYARWASSRALDRKPVRFRRGTAAVSEKVTGQECHCELRLVGRRPGPFDSQARIRPLGYASRCFGLKHPGRSAAARSAQAYRAFPRGQFVQAPERTLLCPAR